MNNPEFWLLKLNALLHDPPDKPLDIQRHEGQSNRWAKILGLTLSKQDFQQADWIASAADRLNFPNYKSIGGADFRVAPYLTHPLAGRRLNLSTGRFLPTQINEAQLQEAIRKSLESIKPEIKQDPQKLFLWLWRNWSAEIQQTEGNQLGALWDLLPADTRIPDHSIWAHQALTSAIAATNSNPAFLLFTISPVQAFISAARRTQDLWAGSYVLSYLNWAAIQAIADEIGPDAVIFPNLIGQPLCDRWLYNQGILPQPRTEDLILPSLPNRFLAIVPASQGENLAKKAAQAVRSQWQKISQAVRLDIEKVLGQSPAWSKTWEKQTTHLFETYWQVYPWRLTEEEPIQDNNFHNFLKPHQPYLGSRFADTERILKIYRDDAGTYAPNIGAIYSDIYFITEKALGSHKSLRDFPQVYETGDKSTLGGDRAALYDGIDHLISPEGNFDQVGRPAIRSFWVNLANSLQNQQPRQYEIQEDGQERLDAVELTKRFAWQCYFQGQFEPNRELVQAGEEETEEKQEQKELLYQLRFPSSSSVATASFRKAVVSKAVGSEAQPLRQALGDWVKSILSCSELRRKNRVRFDVIPYFASKVDSDNLLKNFLTFEGRLLFDETYQEALSGSSEVDRRRIEQALLKLKTFLHVASSEPYNPHSAPLTVTIGYYGNK